MVTFEKKPYRFYGESKREYPHFQFDISRACMRELNLKKEIGIATRMK
jgi:hypothetical protein